MKKNKKIFLISILTLLITQTSFCQNNGTLKDLYYDVPEVTNGAFNDIINGAKGTLLSNWFSNSKTRNIKYKCIDGNCLNGLGKQISSNKDIYIGSFNNGKYNGKGGFYEYNKSKEDFIIKFKGIFKNGILIEGKKFLFKEGTNQILEEGKFEKGYLTEGKSYFLEDKKAHYRLTFNSFNFIIEKGSYAIVNFNNKNKKMYAVIYDKKNNKRYEGEWDKYLKNQLNIGENNFKYFNKTGDKLLLDSNTSESKSFYENGNWRLSGWHNRDSIMRNGKKLVLSYYVESDENGNVLGDTKLFKKTEDGVSRYIPYKTRYFKPKPNGIKGSDITRVTYLDIEAELNGKTKITNLFFDKNQDMYINFTHLNYTTGSQSNLNIIEFTENKFTTYYKNNQIRFTITENIKKYRYNAFKGYKTYRGKFYHKNGQIKYQGQLAKGIPKDYENMENWLFTPTSININIYNEDSKLAHEGKKSLNRGTFFYEENIYKYRLNIINQNKIKVKGTVNKNKIKFDSNYINNITNEIIKYHPLILIKDMINNNQQDWILNNSTFEK